jgi:integrase
VPAKQRGWVRKRKSSWQACWREGGRIRTRSGFPSRTVAKDWLDDHLESGTPRRGREVTFREHVERYLRIHGATVEPSTIQTLRERLGVVVQQHEGENGRRRQRARPRTYRTALEVFGDLTLAELEQMSVEIADWQTTLPLRYRHAIMRALRQVLGAAVRWRLIRTNPAKEAGPNPKPPRVDMPFFASISHVDKVAGELGERFGPIVVFGVETGLRPEEWIALERRDIDRKTRVVKVRRVCVDGLVKEYGKTSRFRRDVPLTARALGAVDSLTPRLETPLLFPAARGGLIDIDNWRRREWRPAIEAAGLDLRLTPYSMRHTYASFALAAGVSIFDLARLMGTSVKVIDETYGHLVRDSHDRVRQALEDRARRDVPRQSPRTADG